MGNHTGLEPIHVRWIEIQVLRDYIVSLRAGRYTGSFERWETAHREVEELYSAGPRDGNAQAET